MQFIIQFVAYVLLYSTLLSLVHASPASYTKLPVVDLGYQRHRAITFDERGQFYNFSNIRYAQAPVGNLRFRKPLAPTGRNPQVQDGRDGHTCPAVYPAWFGIAHQFTAAYLQGQPFDEEAAWQKLNNTPPAPANPAVSEDCLFLDVDVPEKVLKKRLSRHYQGAPVLVWIFGGGFVLGSKDESPGTGLIQASQAFQQDGTIYVRLNYRLGAFGFINGKSTAAQGTLNAGLYDQRLALDWVQKYIHLFGGDAKRVTVMGESAGAVSIAHQLTAFGASKPAPFSRAILQSAAGVINGDAASQEHYEKVFLHHLKVSSINEARSLPSEALIAANAATIRGTPYAIFGFSALIGDAFAPERPFTLLKKGAFDKRVQIMASHTTNEGLLFTNPIFQHPEQVDSAFSSFVSLLLPQLSKKDKDFVIHKLYPAVYDGSSPYKDAVERTALFTADVWFSTSFNTALDVFGPKSYAYEFGIGGALHTNDLPYTFYTGADSSVKFPELAQKLQQYLTSFVTSGKPAALNATKFVQYGKNRNVLQLGNGEITIVKDGSENERVGWWQRWFLDHPL